MTDTYSLLDLFLSMLWFFLFVAWLWLVFSIFSDIVRSEDMSGWAKALWSLFIIVLPLLGVLIYLIARGGRMSERALQRQQAAEDNLRAYIRDAAGSGPSTADELTKLGALRDAGTITDAEFDTQKAKLLG